MKSRSGSGLAAACALIAALVVGVPSAFAVVVHTPNGHFLGILPHQGVAPGSIPGSIAAQRRSNFSSNGNLNYHGGPVVHSSAAYLVFWTPSGFSIPASSRSLIQRYFSDAAAGSGTSSSIFGVDRQFTDGSGFANYQQTFSSTQVVTDTQAFPTFDSIHCASLQFGEATCVSGAQIESEIQRLISTGLPDDGPAPSSSLPSNAPIYFVVLPSNVNVCDQLGRTSCADNTFCAYHSYFTDSSHHNVLYATIPFLPAAQIPKQCQSDGNGTVQEPNGDLADVVLKYLSHEHSEVLTDPVGSGWSDNNNGNEGGDNCNATGSANPQGGTSPKAFLPVLGGSASAGTLYDQQMAGNSYYVQSEWSNGDTGCQMAPSAGTISPAFSLPSGPNPAGSSVGFDPSASTSSNTISSVSWSFGDGGTAFSGGSSLATVHHTYAAAGTYPVTLTLVDDRGNIAKTTHSVAIGLPPTAAFSSSPSNPLENTSASFDASAASDPDAGVHISSYAWNFGDGGTQTVTTPTTSHTFTHFGTYTVTLTVTNSIGLTNSISHQVTIVDEKPVSSFVNEVPNPTTNQLVPFDGSASSDPDGSIASYVWSFGDGHTATGMNPAHAYATAGTYVVTLTVTDNEQPAQTSSSTQQVTVVDGPIASFTYNPTQPLVGDAVAFTNTSSDPTTGTITNYSWDFGDSSTATGRNPPPHTYTHFGTFKVTLTVTDSNGVSDMAPQSIIVREHPPIASFTVQNPVPPAGQAVAFDGTGSSDLDGPITAYSWDFGDNTPLGTGPSPSHTYQSYGTYTVTLKVTVGDGQTATTTQQVAVHALPQAAFTYAPGKPGVGTPIAFDGTGSSDPEQPSVTITSYAWNFGDGGTGGGPTPTHSYAAPADYVVTLTVTNSLGLSNTQTHHVVVLTGPTAAFSVQTPHPTSGQPVAFDASASSDPDSPIASYSWAFGDGGTGTGPSPTYTYSTYGNYTVSLTVTDANGLSNTFTQQVTVHAPPALRFAFAPTAPQLGASVGFDAAGSSDPEPGTSIAFYSWGFGDGATGSGSSTSHTYQRPGTYTVTLTATSSVGTTASITKSVVVYDRLPTAVIVVGSAHPLTGQQVRFDGTHSTGASSPIGSYRWSFGDGGTGSGARLAHVYGKPGSYRVALTVTDGFGGSTTAVASVRVALAGRITGLSLRSAAQGATLVISVNSAGVVSAGHRSFRVRHGGLVRLHILLSTAQLQRLNGNGSLTIHLSLRFTPRLGPPSRKRLTIVFRGQPAHGHRVYARLQR